MLKPSQSHPAYTPRPMMWVPCYVGSMRRTTVFLPDELHEQLRLDAFRAKTSMAELIRAKLRRSIDRPAKRASSKDPILKVAGACSGPVLSREIDDALYGR